MWLKTSFLCGFQATQSDSSPMSSAIETEVSDPFRFFVFVGISMGTGCEALPSLRNIARSGAGGAAFGFCIGIVPRLSEFSDIYENLILQN